MDSPTSGLRRATAMSWALAGLGVAGVAGTSTLAYADTFTPPAVQAPVVAVDLAPPELGPPPPLDMPPPPDAGNAPTEPDPAPPTAPETTDAPAPPTRQTPVPDYTPQYTPQYRPPQTHQPYSPPVTEQSQPPATPPTTKRRNLTPTTVMAPNFSPHVSVSHGS